MLDILKKMHFKGDGTVLNAPSEIGDALRKLGFASTLADKTRSANTLVFFHNEKELLAFLKGPLRKLEPDGVLWFAYPKKTSKIKTDIGRDQIRDLAETFGITTVTAISIDETWSALRFRPIEKVGS